MEEIIKLVINYGAMAVMAGLFVYSWLQDKGKNNKTLEELSKSNNNIASALSLLKESFENQTCSLVKHDERANLIHDDIKEIKFILNERK
jgi:hypothetical protein